MSIGRRLEALLLGPVGLLLVATIVVPAGVLLAYSVYRYNGLTPESAFQLGNYQQVFSEGTYGTFAVNTLLIAVPTTIVSVAGGYLISYWLVYRAGATRNVVLALVVISMMASYLVRIYAWRTLMGEQGVVNSLLETVGVIDEPLGFLIFSRFAAVVAEVNYLLPFTALVAYASLANVAPELREAARDLGAGGWQSVRRVVLPLTGPAVLAASVLTFFLSCADYITPVLVGGTDATTFGTVISDQLRSTGNLPLGAALSFTMVAGYCIVALLFRGGMRATKVLPKEPDDAAS